MKATVDMDLSTHAAGRPSEVRMIEAERVENDDIVDRNLWACSGTFAGCCCQTNLADN